MTREEGINQVMGGGGQVVILGAGASIASTLRNPERGGKVLPSMDNFISVVGLQDIADSLPGHLLAPNFEILYSNLHDDDPHSEVIREIERRVHAYFSDMELPKEPTIYDYLILSLRKKDVIATFNWDPFLWQAYVRNLTFTKDLPLIHFLHGNVAIGWSSALQRFGPIGIHKATGEELKPTRLLYPISQKNYNEDDFISTQWDSIRYSMSKEYKAVRATIFGFGAPATDVEAVKLLNDSWGTPDDRSMEQFEVIDIADQSFLREKWSGFIHSHHYDISSDYFISSLGLNPRRTSEAYFSQYQFLTPDEAFREPNPVPQNLKSLKELWDWHKPLLEAEISAKDESPVES